MTRLSATGLCLIVSVVFGVKPGAEAHNGTIPGEHQDKRNVVRKFEMRQKVSFGEAKKSLSFARILTVRTVNVDSKRGLTYKISSRDEPDFTIRRNLNLAGFAGGFIHLPLKPVRSGGSWRHILPGGTVRSFTFRGWETYKGQRLARIDIRSEGPSGTRGTALVDSTGDTVWSRKVTATVGTSGETVVTYQRISITR